MTKKIKTLSDLKDFLNSLNEDQLKQPATVGIEDEPCKYLVEAEVLTSPIIYNEYDSEDCGTFETLKEIHGEEFREEEYLESFKEGTPLLFASNENPLENEN